MPAGIIEPEATVATVAPGEERAHRRDSRRVHERRRYPRDRCRPTGRRLGAALPNGRRLSADRAAPNADVATVATVATAASAARSSDTSVGSVRSSLMHVMSSPGRRQAGRHRRRRAREARPRQVTGPQTAVGGADENAGAAARRPGCRTRRRCEHSVSRRSRCRRPERASANGRPRGRRALAWAHGRLGCQRQRRATALRRPVGARDRDRT